MIIDFHSHILRGVDHGSIHTSHSVEQLNLMSRYGTDLAVATSHFYPEQLFVDEYIHSVDRAVEALAEYADQLPNIKLCLGAEVLVCDGLDKLEDLHKLCIRGTNTILLEMPTSCNWNRSIMGVVENIICSGYTVVLAHIDRYIEKQEREIDALLSAGALAQVNAISMSFFGSRRRILPYIRSDLVWALGSDLHKTDNALYKRFSLLKKRIGAEKFEQIMERAEGLLKGAEIIELGKKNS